MEEEKYVNYVRDSYLEKYPKKNYEGYISISHINLFLFLICTIALVFIAYYLYVLAYDKHQP